MRALVALTIYVSLAGSAAMGQNDSPTTRASALRNRGEYAGAEKLLREALSGAAVKGEEKALTLNMMGDLMREEGKGEASEKFFRAALQIPGVSWKRLAESHTGLADLDRDSGLWEASVAEWNSVTDLAREHHEPMLEAVAWRGLGQTWIEQGNAARAEPLLRRALAAFESDPRCGNQVAPTLSSMAQLYLEDDKPALAEDALTRAIADEERNLGGGHPQVAILLEMMGDAAALRKRVELTGVYYGRALRIMADKFGEGSTVLAAVLANWATAAQRAGDAVGAALKYEKALAIFRTGDRDAAPLRLNVMQRYADVLKSMHRGREAHAVLAEVKSFREK
jgi:tetratricopeptide (TPR) repeat protein